MSPNSDLRKTVTSLMFLSEFSLSPMLIEPFNSQTSLLTLVLNHQLKTLFLCTFKKKPLLPIITSVTDILQFTAFSYLMYHLGKRWYIEETKL